jgi:hypothetical protein
MLRHLPQVNMTLRLILSSKMSFVTKLLKHFVPKNLILMLLFTLIKGLRNISKYFLVFLSLSTDGMQSNETQIKACCRYCCY